jgi:hypothetical protein
VANAEGRIVIEREPVPPGRYEIRTYLGQHKLVVSEPVTTTPTAFHSDVAGPDDDHPGHAPSLVGPPPARG